MSSSQSLDRDIQHLKSEVEKFIATEDSASLPSSSRKAINKSIEEASQTLARLTAKVDPIRRPASIFDPSDPATAGRIIALTLAAQEKHPLSEVPQFYGSGVYAIYYCGNFDGYRAISGKEHPIYVGKAKVDPIFQTIV